MNAKGKVEALDNIDSKENIIKFMRSQIDAIRNLICTSKYKTMNVIDGLDTYNIIIHETVCGMIWNSYLTTHYGVFNIVPVKNALSEFNQITSVSTKEPVSFNTVLAELSNKIGERENKKIPMAPALPKQKISYINKNLNNNIILTSEKNLQISLRNKLLKRREQIEGINEYQ